MCSSCCFFQKKGAKWVDLSLPQMVIVVNIRNVCLVGLPIPVFNLLKRFGTLFLAKVGILERMRNGATWK